MKKKICGPDRCPLSSSYKKMNVVGKVVQSPNNLTLDKQDFLFQFSGYQRGFLFIYFVLQFWAWAISNYAKDKKRQTLILQITFYPGLELTGFWLTQPWAFIESFLFLVPHVFTWHWEWLCHKLCDSVETRQKILNRFPGTVQTVVILPMNKIFFLSRRSSASSYNFVHLWK